MIHLQSPAARDSLPMVGGFLPRICEAIGGGFCAAAGYPNGVGGIRAHLFKSGKWLMDESQESINASADEFAWPTRAAAEAAIRQFAAREQAAGTQTASDIRSAPRPDSEADCAAPNESSRDAVVSAVQSPDARPSCSAAVQSKAFGCVKETIRVLSGTYFDFLDPQPDQFNLADVANALSKICRFGGQIGKFYSVAEHSVRCAEQALADGMPPMGVIAALMHDAAEAFVGDVVKPLKIMLPEYSVVEKRVEAAIAAKWQIDFAGWEKAVREIDHAMLINERRHLFSADKVTWFGENEVRELYGKPQCWSPERACQEFFDMAKSMGIEAPSPTPAPAPEPAGKVGEKELPDSWGHWLDKDGNHWWIFGKPGKFMAQCLDAETGMPDDETPNCRLQELIGAMRGGWHKLSATPCPRCEELAADLNTVNELGREFCYGQGELDDDLAGCLRKSIGQLTSDLTRLRSQLDGVSGALVDAGNITIRHDNYAESVRELTRERDRLAAENAEYKRWFDGEGAESSATSAATKEGDMVRAANVIKAKNTQLAELTAERDRLRGEVERTKSEWSVMARAVGNWREWPCKPTGEDGAALKDWTHDDWKAAARAMMERNKLQAKLLAAERELKELRGRVS